MPEGEEAPAALPYVHDATYVLTVVIDILLWSSAVFENIVIVPVVNNQSSTRFEHIVEVLVPEITMVIDQMRERVAHADDGIVSRPRSSNVLGQCHPVPFLNLPVEEGLLSSSVPANFVGFLEHFVGVVTGRQRKGRDVTHFIQQHHRIDTSPTCSVQDGVGLFFLEQLDKEVLVVGGPGHVLSDVEMPHFSCSSICILISNTGLSYSRRYCLNGTHP